jgi:acyl-CoA thioesterase-2
MQQALDRLIELLDLEELEVNIFRGRSPQEDRQRVFGGQVAGQALVAAGRTVEEGVVHSLHAYFLRPGDPAIPILYEVDRIRDGRSFTTRRVVAIQHGHAIFNMSVSFHTPEPGLEHQLPMPECPLPEALPTWEDRMARVLESPASRDHPDLKHWVERDRPIDMRFVDPVDLFDPEKAAPRAHGIAWMDGTLMVASLDHAMWFHRAVRADEWLLYAQESPAAAGARGFTTGQVYARGGGIVASVAQEGLIRRLEGSG